MTHEDNLKIIAFVGLPGSGKSSAVEYLTDKGYPRVYFGGVILDGLADKGIEVTPENEKKYREETRAVEGKDFVVKRIIKQIQDLAEAGQHRIVADGLYSWTEYKVLKTEFPGELIVVAILAPKSIRHRRLNDRPVRPLTNTEADARDWAEIENLEKGGPIAIADHFIINDGDLEKLHLNLAGILKEISF